MRYIKKFENIEQDESRFTPKPRIKKDEDRKRCLGRCDRKVIIKDGKPVIYCSGCDRLIKSL